MLYKLKQFIFMLLPYWLVINIYKRNKAIPANIRTSSGKSLKAVMVTSKYGILFYADVYYKNRIKFLQQKSDQITAQSNNLTKELNELSFEARELYLRNKGENSES